MEIEQVTPEQITEEAFKKKVISESIALLQKYKNGNQKYEQKLIENEQWFKSRHWDYIRNANFADDPEPVTSFLLSTLANKHADFMDFYPSANALPREGDDKEEAKQLSKILPIEFEYNDFKDTWDTHSWEKLKHGCGIFGVLYDPDGADGIGAGTVKEVDGLNIYHQPGINKIDESGSVFITRIITNEQFEEDYPDNDVKKAGKVFEPSKYLNDDTIDLTDCTVMIDRYYKKRNEMGKKILHLLQFAGEELIYCSELDEELTADGRPRKDVGIYAHGKFPFFFDTLFPEKNSIRGFGLIDIARNPQLYIDKLDQIIVRNAFTSGRNRHLVSESSSINEAEFLDVSKDIVHFAGTLDDTKFRTLTTDSIATDISNHRIQKIAEIKEITSTNDSSRGESASGVTAASAILALQKASGKVSRADINKSYSVFSNVVYCYVDIIREFYDIPRPYRIQENKEDKFIEYSNAGIKNQELPVIPGMEAEEKQYRKPIFDIKIVPERQDPFSQAAHNEMAKELYTLGVFNPEAYMQAKVMFEMMSFEGMDEVLRMMGENDQTMQLLSQLPQLQVENQKLMMIVQKLTGEDMGVDLNGPSQVKPM